MNILHLLSTDGFISVNKTLIKKVGLEAAVLIGELSSEFIYHSNKGYLTEDGYFFSTVKNIEDKTTIKEKRQRAILKELEEMELIKTVKRGLPSKRYIKINQNNLLNLISIPNKNGQNGGTVTVDKAELIPSVEATNNNINNNNINNNKTYSPKFSTFDMEAAEKLYNLILINNPNHKKPKLEKWANDVRLMRIKDKRTEEQIMYVINWSQNNKFWKSNILSIAKLREKFDQLVIKIKSEKENKVNENFNKPKQDAMSMMLEQLNLGGYENEPVNEPRRDQLLISKDGSTL